MLLLQAVRLSVRFFSCMNWHMQAVIDYLMAPSGGAMPAGGKVQEFQNPLRKDFHLLGAGSNNTRKGGMLDLYGGPKPGTPLLPLLPLS